MSAGWRGMGYRNVSGTLVFYTESSIVRPWPADPREHRVDLPSRSWWRRVWDAYIPSVMAPETEEEWQDRQW